MVQGGEQRCGQQAARDVPAEKPVTGKLSEDRWGKRWVRHLIAALYNQL
jgi:hypothetical protein